MAASLLLLLVLVVPALANPGFALHSILHGGGWEGGSCGPSNLTIETPACTVLAKNDGYELRKYPDVEMWALTTVANASYGNALRTGFYRCFNFISGGNSRHEKIEMTGPVRIHPEPKSSGYSVGFFVPSKFKTLDDVPKPNNPAVHVVSFASKTRAVFGPFGGFPGRSTYEAQVAHLKGLLDEDSVTYDPDSVAYAGYSSPFRFLHRKQEVWLDVTKSIAQSV